MVTIVLSILFLNYVGSRFNLINFITDCNILREFDLFSLGLGTDGCVWLTLELINIPVSTNTNIKGATELREEFIKNLRKTAVKFYENAKSDYKQILNENKGKSGIYLWYNRINGHTYVGQSKNLGDTRVGRLVNYYKDGYLNSRTRGNSLIRKALLKYGHENFSLIILEYCPIDLLDIREQHWLDFLEPYYNILNFVKSSRGYKHTLDALNKMRGPRPNYKLTPEHLAKLASSAKNRIYDKSFRDAISERKGFTLYVYDKLGKLLNTYPSVIKFKEAYGIKLHHKTLYKQISQGTLINGLIISFTPISSLDVQHSSIVSTVNNKLRARQIQLTNIVNPELTKTLSSITAAAAYIKQVDGRCDKGSMRKYIHSDKLYHNTWKLHEV